MWLNQSKLRVTLSLKWVKNSIFNWLVTQKTYVAQIWEKNGFSALVLASSVHPCRLATFNVSDSWREKRKDPVVLHNSSAKHRQKQFIYWDIWVQELFFLYYLLDDIYIEECTAQPSLSALGLLKCETLLLYHNKHVVSGREGTNTSVSIKTSSIEKEKVWFMPYLKQMLLNRISLVMNHDSL